MPRDVTHILILEDNLEVLSLLLKHLAGLEKEMIASEPINDIAVTVLSTYKDVENLINPHISAHDTLGDLSRYDIVLLDRRLQDRGILSCPRYRGNRPRADHLYIFKPGVE